MGERAQRALGRVRAGLLGPSLAAGLVAAVDLALRFEGYRSRADALALRAGALDVVGLYGLALLASLGLHALLWSVPRIGRWLSAGCVALLVPAQLAFHSVMGSYWNERDLQNAWHSDANTSLVALAAFFESRMLGFLAAGLALGAVTLALFRALPAPASTRRALALGALVFGGHFLLWGHLYRKCHDFPVDPVLHSVRAAFFAEHEAREFLGVVRGPSMLAEATTPPADNVVFVLDESIRYGFLSTHDASLATTPFLRELSGQPGFRDWGLMLAASTCSMTSEAMLLTGTTRAPDTERRALRNPTLFQHAQRRGYHTVLVDAWGDAFPNPVIRRSDLDAVDERVAGDGIPGPHAHPDLNAAHWVRRRVAERRGQFIFVLKRGAHFHYEQAYPDGPEWRRFEPTLAPWESYGSSRERMLNSYRNAVAFSVDAFLEVLVPEELDDTTIVWTSDHGQSLQEQGQTYTHCRHELEQALVPFFMLTGTGWVRGALDSGVAGDGGGVPPVYSHHNVYPTLLALLLGQPEAENAGFHSLLAPGASPPPLYYLHGDLWHGSRVMDVGAAELERFRPTSPPPRRREPSVRLEVVQPSTATTS